MRIIRVMRMIRVVFCFARRWLSFTVITFEKEGKSHFYQVTEKGKANFKTDNFGAN